MGKKSSRTKSKSKSNFGAKSHKKYRILVANGVNLDLLGQREPEIYGRDTLEEIQTKIVFDMEQFVQSLDLPEYELHFFQSNHEGVFLDTIGAPGWDGIVLNPGAWSHTSLAIADRIRGLTVPCVEVHLSNIHAREAERQTTITGAASTGIVSGFGADSYLMGLLVLIRKLSDPNH